MPVFYDAEEYNYYGFQYTSQVYTETLTAFANKMAQYGFPVSIYGSYSWLTAGWGPLNSNVIRSYPIWVAQYNETCDYPGAVLGWQYRSDGSLPGINGRVDLSIFL